MKKKSNGCLPLTIQLVLILLAGIVMIEFIVYIGNSRYWKLLFLLIPAFLVVAYIVGAREQRAERKKKIEYLTAGKIIFYSYAAEFADFYQKNLNGKKKRKAEPVDVLCQFAKRKSLLHVVDWRGEDEEGEIEEFIEKLLGQKIAWPRVLTLRNTLPFGRQKDGKFIVRLFKAADEDLKAVGQRLLFLGLGDSYEYTIVSAKAFDDIAFSKLDGLRGAEGLG